MKKLTIFIDGYNLYHAIDNLGKPHLKWANPKIFCKFFINHKIEEIVRVKFFTAFPTHKSEDTQKRYKSFTDALKHYGIEIIEGNFKKKSITIYEQDRKYVKFTHEEKESDVNIALAVLEDAFETISDRILIVTNDSDITPAIKMARRKNKQLKISILTPPIESTKYISNSLYFASGNVEKNQKGQIFHNFVILKEFMLEQAIMPDEIVTEDGRKISIPNEYKKPN